jgi:hypothetical protein
MVSTESELTHPQDRRSALRHAQQHAQCIADVGSNLIVLRIIAIEIRVKGRGWCEERIWRNSCDARDLRFSRNFPIRLEGAGVPPSRTTPGPTQL